MKLRISSVIPVSANRAWKLVKCSSTLLYVTRGLMGFRPIHSTLPVEWQQGRTEKVRIWLFGFIPSWTHQIHFSAISETEKTLFTRESGGVVDR